MANSVRCLKTNKKSTESNGIKETLDDTDAIKGESVDTGESNEFDERRFDYINFEKFESI